MAQGAAWYLLYWLLIGIVTRALLGSGSKPFGSQSIGRSRRLSLAGAGSLAERHSQAVNIDFLVPW
ncbi:hypothetical protein P4050_30660 [Pseudomonas aeruginosa]|nr:hypothetical protein [Pseudomonas aeruginosa]